MLAGRKLLLADDSITIQKIVALTFADEGIQVVAVSDGAEAVEALEEILPDIVLADVHMPNLTGYQVCEHIKRTERLKHIKVMLLVGSFEPFDEVEARRVGADDTLTKPFQSIRNLVDKVSSLLGRQTPAEQLEKTLPGYPEPAPNADSFTEPAAVAEEVVAARVEEIIDLAVAQEAGTRELPPPELVLPPDEPMTTDELEVVTADTQPLSADILHRTQQFASPEAHVVETVLETETMQTNPVSKPRPESSEGFGDALLELDAFEAAGFGNDVMLDVDLDVDFESPSPEMLSSPWGSVQTVAVAAPIFAATPVVEKSDPITPSDFRTRELVAPRPSHEDAVAPVSSSFAEAVPAVQDAHDAPPHVHQPEYISEAPATTSSANTASAAPVGLIKLDQLAPEVVDAIARRVVEQLSEKAVQEIAWEVVPQLADLMIKRKLEESETQNK